MSNRVTLTAATEEQADFILAFLLNAEKQLFLSEASAEDIRHYAQIVANRLGIAFCVDHENNVRVDNGTVRWSGRP